jgi:hypothetical protein
MNGIPSSARAKCVRTPASGSSGPATLVKVQRSLSGTPADASRCRPRRAPRCAARGDGLLQTSALAPPGQHRVAGRRPRPSGHQRRPAPGSRARTARRSTPSSLATATRPTHNQRLRDPHHPPGRRRRLTTAITSAACQLWARAKFARMARAMRATVGLPVSARPAGQRPLLPRRAAQAFPAGKVGCGGFDPHRSVP